VGKLFIGLTDHGLVSLQFVDTEDEFRARIEQRTQALIVYAPEKLEEATQQVEEYLSGERGAFELPVDISSMTPFQQTVLDEVAKVPRGEVVTYGELAKRIGKPRAARAVGQALGSNPVPIVVPCHRVIASDGSLGGYSGRRGVETKATLLTLEGAWL
jgi:methylated-DNA-[protein]-cysteine S-methyltransferase